MAEISSPNTNTALPAQIASTKLLIGEGKDEVQVFTALLRHLGLERVQVEEYGGKSKLRTYLKTLQLRDGFADLTALGVTRDADADAPGAWRSVCDALQKNGFPVLAANGQILGGTPNLGIMVIGDGGAIKMLEDLCLESVRQDASWPCLAEFFACLKNAQCEPPNVSKARFSTWMAIQADANARGLGGAATQNYFDWNSAVFTELKAFLTSLFTDQPDEKGRADEIS